MELKVFTKDQVEHFMEFGWVKLEQAFSRDDALTAQEFLWGKLAERGVIKDDRSTWTQAMVRMNEGYEAPEFRACNTERLADAIEDLLGRNRWSQRGKDMGWGWWPVNFAVGADKPWDVPLTGWHYDGQHFRHYVDSWEQGLLLLPLFSEIGAQGGGTVIAEGSHNIVAKVLAEHPEGLDHPEAIKLAKQHPWLAEVSGAIAQDNTSAPTDIYASDEVAAAGAEVGRIEKFMNNVYRDPDGYNLRVAETTGSPGDVIFCHPFLFHASAPNLSGKPRFMCNKTTPLKERMQLHRDNAADYSPVELSIRKALKLN
jgi:hypothetical protein